MRDTAQVLEKLEIHPDDLAVSVFAEAMKAKLSQARAKGRSGWEDPDQCSARFLADLLVGHVSKSNEGNLEDIACLAMMLYMRGDDPSVVAEAFRDRLAGKDRSAEPAYTSPVRASAASIEAWYQASMERVLKTLTRECADLDDARRRTVIEQRHDSAARVVFDGTVVAEFTPPGTNLAEPMVWRLKVSDWLRQKLESTDETPE